MATPNPSRDEELTTLTFTGRERRQLAHALTICAAMADSLGNDGAKSLLELWERVQPDEIEAA